MSQDQHISCALAGEEVSLLAAKALYWPRKKILVLGDLHLGKAAHFRKHGLAVPATVEEDNLKRLASLIEWLRPTEIIFLGDLFHSSMNRSWDQFASFLKAYPRLRRCLVIGNHDILPKTSFQEAELLLHPSLHIPPFTFTHDRDADCTGFNIHAHIHPSFRLRGLGRQSLKLPCFVIDRKKRYAVLPSFGAFTGSSMVSKGKHQDIFLCTGTSISKLS